MHDEYFSKRIVIGGLPRSGSTLFRYILDASSSIVSGPETGFFRRPLPQQKKSITSVARRINQALSIGENIIGEIVLTSSTSLEAYDRMMREYCLNNELEKNTWAEKTPRNCFSYNWIYAENSDVFFFSMVRDGRDVVTSILSGMTEYHCSIERYIETLEAVYSFHSDNHMILHYEDLVLNPEEEMRKVFTFLSVPFNPEVLQRYRVASATRDPSRVRQENVSKDISSQFVGRWKHPRHKSRINEFLANATAKYWLEKSGYE